MFSDDFQPVLAMKFLVESEFQGQEPPRTQETTKTNKNKTKNKTKTKQKHCLGRPLSQATFRGGAPRVAPKKGTTVEIGKPSKT